MLKAMEVFCNLLKESAESRRGSWRDNGEKSEEYYVLDDAEGIEAEFKRAEELVLLLNALAVRALFEGISTSLNCIVNQIPLLKIGKAHKLLTIYSPPHL